MAKQTSRIDELRKKIDFHPHDPEAYCQLGTFYLEKESYDDAVALFEHAIEIKPDYLDALQKAGIAYTQLGKFKEALFMFKQCVGIDPENPALKKNLECAGSNLSHQAEALAAYHKTLSISKVAKEVKAVCGYCSTGCQFTIETTENEEAVKVHTSKDYSVNLGKACPKGIRGLDHLPSEYRAVTPLRRTTSGTFEPVEWHEAMKAFCGNFKSIQEKYGKESVAFLSTGQIPMEEMAFLGCLSKFGMGILHGDGNTRQCMASAAVAYKQSFGFDAPPFTYKDFEESDLLVFFGSNFMIAHFIMWTHIAKNPHKPTIIVVDPRKTNTTAKASVHYKITPKTDLTLLYALAHILIKNKWIDETFIAQSTTGFDEFKKHVETFTPERASRESGLSVEEIHQFAETIRTAKRPSFYWTMGVNQSWMGVRTAQAIINLSLMTGAIGKPGTGPNSITGQANAMGSRIFSNTTSLLAGRDFTNEQHRKEIADILNIDPALIPSKNGLPYHKIVEGIKNNEIKGLWVIATNPTHSWINQSEFQEVIKNLEYLVVQDMFYNTETAQEADLILPAAGWGEKDGTFINSERRIGVVQAACTPPGKALSDFAIFRLIARYWGCGELFKQWTSPEAVFDILKKCSKGMPCDISGIRDYKMLLECGGIQWPFPEGSSLNNNQRRLFEDGIFYHPDGKAKFLFTDILPAPEKIDAAFPFILITGRGTIVQWHTQTRTGKSAILRNMYPQDPYVEIHPDDAEKLGIKNEQWVHVASRRDIVKAVASVTDNIQAGQLFMPMHYKETNRLTFPAFDTYSGQPSYKYCAVKVYK
ncbi:molybdopterin-dependent oxidoreductase [bacterium]|nr:molybdopterin-dependent oxidoreductase [bacterium]